MPVEFGQILLILALFGILATIFYIGFKESYRSREGEDEEQ